MFISYLKIFFRNLVKRRIYTVINILGLAIGIACFILIMLYVVNELSYDRYHKNADRTYRVCMIYDFSGVGENSASQPFPVAFTLKSEYPDIVENAVRLFNFQSTRNLIEYKEQKFIESRFFFADSTFFEIFDYDFLEGNPRNALNLPGSVVITESMAHKYFGREDPLGKVITFEVNNQMNVTGVIRDVPEESHFIFDFIGSMSTVKQMYKGMLPKTWVWNPCWTYIVLAKGVTPNQLEEKFPGFIQKYFYDAQKPSITMYLQKLTDIHLKSRLDYEIQPNSTYIYVIILTAIAVFLLIIACINFMNLTTATSASRAREIGIKKVTGAHRMQLIRQFIAESLAMTLMAMIAALILIEIVLPAFNLYTGKDIRLGGILQPSYFAGLTILWLIVGTLSGAYPAFFLSSFRPISVLRGTFHNDIRSGMARKILVIFQFTISIGLIIGTIIIFWQIRYLQQADLGFNKKNIILLPVNRTKVADNYTSFKRDILQNSNIVSVTAVDDIVGASHNTHEFRHEGVGENKWRFYPALIVKEDFVKTFGLTIVAGRDYSEDCKTDPMEGILINESMVKHLGWKSNEEALGKKFKSLNGDEKVIGVFKDFHARSLREPAGPFVLNMKERPEEILYFLQYVAIRIGNGNPQETIAYLEKKWDEFEKLRPFDYMFLEDQLNNLYKDEKNLGMLSLIFTVLIMFVAAMGIFGLASFMAEKRIKEISIRKVMGANLKDILLLLSKEFVSLIIIAMVIAWPLSYILIETYFLRQFTIQVPFSLWVYIISGLFAMILALIIIFYRAYAASLINPAETLKHE
jgi:putative ABC transport system permease protein